MFRLCEEVIKSLNAFFEKREIDFQARAHAAICHNFDRISKKNERNMFVRFECVLCVIPVSSLFVFARFRSLLCTSQSNFHWSFLKIYWYILCYTLQCFPYYLLVYPTVKLRSHSVFLDTLCYNTTLLKLIISGQLFFSESPFNSDGGPFLFDISPATYFYRQAGRGEVMIEQKKELSKNGLSLG